MKSNKKTKKISYKINNTTINGKSIGIISMNNEGKYFSKDIENSIKLKFKDFQNLDIIIAGFQEDKQKSGSVTFVNSLLPNHNMLTDIYLSGIGKIGFRGTRMLVFVNSSGNISIKDIKTTKICDNSSCLFGLPCCNKGLNAVSFFNDLIILNSHIVLGIHKFLFREAIDKRVCMMENLFEKMKKSFNIDDIKNKKIIWFGDLNFRVSPKIQTLDGIMNMVEQYIEPTGKELNKKIRNLKIHLKENSLNIKEYLKNDELTKLLKGEYENLKCVFPLELFEEKITFNPSCKLQKGTTDIYNIIHKGKYRLPSWCDRILFNSNIKKEYNVEYKTFKFPIDSDHNGVFAILLPKKKTKTHKNK